MEDFQRIKSRRCIRCYLKIFIVYWWVMGWKGLVRSSCVAEFVYRRGDFRRICYGHFIPSFEC